MSYGTSLGITLPTVGVTAGPTWATNLNTALSTVISVLETKVTPAGMDINADLSYRSSGTSYRAKDVKALSLTNQDSVLAAATYATTLFSSDSDGELYYNDNAGRQVQITTNGAVNVSTSGGITGTGYGASSVEVNWVAASSRYDMKSGAGANDYASVLANDILLNDGSANTLTIAAPSLAADYTLTLPNAVAASNGSLVTMSTAGALAATMAPSVTTVTTSGLITAGGGVTASADQHVTVSGSGKFKHGARELCISGANFHPSAETTDFTRQTYITHNSATDADYVAAIPLPVGCRITSIVIYMTHGTGTGNRTYTLYRTALATGTSTDLGNDGDTTSASDVTITLAAINHTILTLNAYTLFIELRESGDIIKGAVINYDHP